MNVLVCIDDTDSLDSRGTGELAAILAQTVEKNGWGRCGVVTRHQLFVHPDIPYTSHNSSMCFTADIEQQNLTKVTEYAASFLESESAEGSDPGLCIAILENVPRTDLLVEFGYRAKKTVLSMEDAHKVAEESGVHLSGHGGTSQGVIGALAGVGLRLGGNDGRMRGSLEIPNSQGVASVREILSHPQVDAVRTLQGVSLNGDMLVRFVDKVKTVLLGGKLVLLVAADGVGDSGISWKTCTRQQLKAY
ncbi:MAG: hypothetical protein EG828_08290 [Deltaproteobacteria bacterium]|nr:hypothetical protein [Deltaproteobacteria bacterium]